MKNRNTSTEILLILGLGYFLVALSSCSASPTPTVVMEGDRPSYVDISTCSTNAQLAIQNKHLPVDLIHSCKDERLELDTGEKVNLITIQYGEAMDCPAGCIYETYVGVITQDRTLVDLPTTDVATGMWGRPPFNEWRNWWTEGHSSQSHQEVAVRNGHYGWVLKLDYYKFTLLYWKSYGENAELGKTLYTASGEIFVYLDASGEEVWDYSRFNTSTQVIQ